MQKAVVHSYGSIISFSVSVKWATAYGLCRNSCSYREVIVSQSEPTGSSEDVNRGPTSEDQMGKLEPVDGARHFNIGEHCSNITSLFENRDGLDPCPGFDNVIACLLDDCGGHPSEQDFVLDDEHDWSAARVMHDRFR